MLNVQNSQTSSIPREKIAYSIPTEGTDGKETYPENLNRILSSTSYRMAEASKIKILTPADCTGHDFSHCIENHPYSEAQLPVCNNALKICFIVSFAGA